ncbi:MAG TPA: carbohydrate kinase family protein [Candidatus Paceibacterota bacterium]|nr:carbohydrate kinase family protein [Candidatus Paceibacterota bacterium]
MEQPLDFVAIGDTAVDEFIRLKDAKVTCDIDSENCTISMKWGDKLPFEYSVLLPGVGNAANAAVSAARLGLHAGFVSNVGKDRYGEEILASFAREGVDASCVAVNEGMITNHHYVLWYESERTILIKHEDYPYVLPDNFVAPRWIYLSSAGAQSEAFHGALTTWLMEHPETKIAFQPGTFQISMGKEKLAPLYARTDFLAVNKEEAERILGRGKEDIKTLLGDLAALGPKQVLITDGPKGAYAYDGTDMFMVPMYPDPKPPFERTGAGDACTSTIVVAMALGKPLQEALLWGPVNSMAVVQEIGAQKGLLTRPALEKFLTEAPETYKVSPL